MTEGRKALLIILVFFVIMGGFYFYKTADLNKEIDQIDIEIDKERELLDAIQGNLSEVKKQPTIDDIVKYAEGLPGERGNPQILEYFYKVAKENNIKTLSINFDDDNPMEKEQIDGSQKKEGEQPQEQKENGLKTIKVNLMVQGGFNELRYFIQNIHQSKRIINLANWQWAITGNTAPVVQLSFKTYYFPDLKDQLPPVKPIETYEPSNRINPAVIE